MRHKNVIHLSGCRLYSLSSVSYLLRYRHNVDRQDLRLEIISAVVLPADIFISSLNERNSAGMSSCLGPFRITIQLVVSSKRDAILMLL